MRNVFCLLIVIFLNNAFYVLAADTGIIEIYSQPSGASIFIDGNYVGKTPYSDPFVSTGRHSIRASFGNDFPDQFWSVSIDNITPKAKTFIFKQEGSKGQFTGVEETQITEKYKGNLQLASIPTGASVLINNQRLKNTPIGYKDIDVGRYEIIFKLGNKELSSGFDIVKGQTVKLVALFEKGVVVNSYEEEQRKRQQQRDEENNAKRKEKREKAIKQLGKRPIANFTTPSTSNSMFSKEYGRGPTHNSSSWIPAKMYFEKSFTSRSGDRHTISLKNFFRGEYISETLFSNDKWNFDSKWVFTFDDKTFSKTWDANDLNYKDVGSWLDRLEVDYFNIKVVGWKAFNIKIYEPYTEKDIIDLMNKL